MFTSWLMCCSWSAKLMCCLAYKMKSAKELVTCVHSRVTDTLWTLWSIRQLSRTVRGSKIYHQRSAYNGPFDQPGLFPGRALFKRQRQLLTHIARKWRKLWLVSLSSRLSDCRPPLRLQGLSPLLYSVSHIPFFLVSSSEPAVWHWPITTSNLSGIASQQSV